MGYKDRFTKADLETFLQAIDRNLKEPFRINLIGETVAILGFGAKRGTGDIDVTSDIQPILDAIQKAEEETGLSIDVSSVGVYDAPYEYEERMERLDIPGLEKLEVFAPEKHDWALLKTARFLSKDVEDIFEVNQEVGLDKEILLQRFINEMRYTSGHPRTLIGYFIRVMEDLYGEAEAEKAREAIMAHPEWKVRIAEVPGMGKHEKRRIKK